MTEFIRPDNKQSVEVFNPYTALAGRISSHEYKPMPEGFPHESFDVARWWLDTMFEKQDKFENAAEHVSRSFIAFVKFMNMGQKKRSAIIKGVTVRKTPYRGDSYDVYVAIVKAKMKDDENPNFRKETIKKMRSIKVGE